MKGIALACAVALAVMSWCGKPSAAEQAAPLRPSATDHAGVSTSAGVQAKPVVAPEPATAWVYSEHKDEMRGATQYTAFTESLNSIDLPFPYSGGSNMLLAIRKTASGKTQAILIIKKGQISCAYDGCSVSLKFDDKQIYRAPAVWAGGGATDTVFIENASGFIKRLRASRKLIAELPIYNAGYRQFTFETAALKWAH